MKPWTRWWWMGSAVDKKNLDLRLTQMADAGIGGVEITPIYGVKGYEDRYIDFLSPTWMDMLDFTEQKANSLGMGVDMNTGTGWPFGGPQITSNFAAAKLIVTQPGQAVARKLFTAKLTTGIPMQERLGSPLETVIAINEQGKRISITDKVDADQLLTWTPEEGKWTIYAAFCGKTGQKVKRAAPGGEGFVMDHYTKKPVEIYLKRFTDAFQGHRKGIDAFFNDSYEVYEANWSPDLFETFEKEKGYDLRPYIKELMGDEETDLVARLKCDYNEVLGDMLLHNFTKKWVDWAHQNGAKAKNQAHGSPGNLLDLYSAADIPECEAYFGISKFSIPELIYDEADLDRDQFEHNPVIFKYASSAAHFYEKSMTSSETFVWQTEHFRTAFSRCKPEVEKLFLSGVNHVYFHGSTFSPEDAVWPGWTFYASTNFVPANSTWPHLEAMNKYITRCQSVLQIGKPDNEILVYWPVYDQWNKADGMEKRFNMHDLDKWLFPTDFYKTVNILQRDGFSTDFVSDKMIAEAASGEHKASFSEKVLIVPECHYMPAKTLENILALAKSGVLVVFKSLPRDVPGYANLDVNRKKFTKDLNGLQFAPDAKGIKSMRIGSGKVILATDLTGALETNSVLPEEITDFGLQFIRRKLDDGKYYYLVNHSSNAIDGFVPLHVKDDAAILMNPQTGTFGIASSKTDDGKLEVRIQLQPGEAMIVRTYTNSKNSFNVNPWSYWGSPLASTVITGPWKLHFTQGGPELPEDKTIDELKSWTLLGDAKAVAFSGSGVYTTTFEMDYISANEYMLNLGKVSESAHVWINGKDAGIAWSIPFQLKIKQFLKTGTNTLKIEVANLSANRIRDMDRRGVKWRNYHEINFVNIKYQPFDASNWDPVPSGLMGPVTITAYTTDQYLESRDWLHGWKALPHPSINRDELALQIKTNKSLWDKAFDFLANTNLDSIPPGRYPIVGDSVFATVTLAPSKKIDVSKWESHHEYIDIHHVIKGKEMIGMSPLLALTIRDAYDPEKEIMFWEDHGGRSYYEATPGNFFIFFPDNAHRPNIEIPGYDPVKKVVVKIRYHHTNKPTL
ncbi:YhcH/YjgK/YiaL family protein [Sunxiuqinia indica]|uniref:YhcH/YjgK/YiaL family protein n=1 Tax=Sunxiuqinia indica TaxID=2692584 RepID=UPI001916AA2D|nr:YhcH/YjgK/YiaL family protein [Sunxiuqinia indica]